MRNAYNLLGHELIGLNAKVLESKDRNKKGIFGKVVDETKNFIVLDTGTGDKKIQKKEAVFEFEVSGSRVLVEGRLLNYRPEDRTKVFAKKYLNKTKEVL